jgi:hypothetical protein
VICGINAVMNPTASFPTSRVTAAIFPLAAELKKSLISKMFAEAIANIVKNGIRIATGGVICFINDMASIVNGIGIKVAVGLFKTLAGRMLDIVFLKLLANKNYIVDQVSAKYLSQLYGISSSKIHVIWNSSFDDL